MIDREWQEEKLKKRMIVAARNMEREKFLSMRKVSASGKVYIFKNRRDKHE